MWSCHYCRFELSWEVRSKNRLCPECGSDLHCCKNCIHYNEALSDKCDEPNSEWVNDRSRQNGCAFFEFKQKDKNPEAALKASSDAEKAKAAFRALFRTTS